MSPSQSVGIVISSPPTLSSPLTASMPPATTRRYATADTAMPTPILILRGGSASISCPCTQSVDRAEVLGSASVTKDRHTAMRNMNCTILPNGILPST